MLEQYVLHQGADDGKDERGSGAMAASVRRCRGLMLPMRALDNVRIVWDNKAPNGATSPQPMIDLLCLPRWQQAGLTTAPASQAPQQHT